MLREEEIRERFRTLGDYEHILTRKKGDVSEFPGNKKAVLLFSGGMDSVVTAAKLIEEQDIEIFPLFFNRGQQNLVQEQRSVAFFTHFLQSKYGSDKFHEPITLDIAIPAPALKEALRNRDVVHGKGYPLRNTIMMHYAVQYAVALSSPDDPVRTVFTGDVAGTGFAHSTLVAFRSVTLAVCQSMNDWQWTITAPNIDPCLAEPLQKKSDLVHWAYCHSIPIDQAFSCYRPLREDGLPCGYCAACLTRKHAYECNEWRQLKPVVIRGKEVASFPDGIYIDLDETLVHTTAFPLEQRESVLDVVMRDCPDHAVFEREVAGALIVSIFRQNTQQFFDTLQQYQADNKLVILYSLAGETHVLPIVQFIEATFNFTFDGVIHNGHAPDLSRKDVSPKSVLLDDVDFNESTHKVEKFRWGFIGGKIQMINPIFQTSGIEPFFKRCSESVSTYSPSLLDEPST